MLCKFLALGAREGTVFCEEGDRRRAAVSLVVLRCCLPLCRGSMLNERPSGELKVYGPYTRKDGRQHVILYENGKRKTVSYPKYLLEQKLGRALLEDETCDHIDGDFTNNCLSNLQVLSRSDNSLKSAALRKPEEAYFVCPECRTSFYKPMRDVRGNQVKQKKAGPFCSKKCAGKYGQRLKKTFRGGQPNPRYYDDTPA